MMRVLALLLLLGMQMRVMTHAAELTDPDDPALHDLAVAALARARVLSIIFPDASRLAGEIVTLEEALQQLDARVLDTEILLELPADVLFDFDKASLRDDAIPSLQSLAIILRETDIQSIRIDGHTDAFGSHEYNDSLSLARARAVGSWLNSNVPVDAAQVELRGLGKRQPKVSELTADGKDNPDARQINRRVAITIRKLESGKAASAKG